MAWYNSIFKATNKNTWGETVFCIEEKDPIIESVPEPEEWIWVEGYKGVDQNMQGYKGFQYELNKEYSVDGEVEECKNGLHFSLKLDDVFHYKNCLTHRFFKVKAYVRKKMSMFMVI